MACVRPLEGKEKAPTAKDEDAAGASWPVLDSGEFIRLKPNLAQSAAEAKEKPRPEPGLHEGGNSALIRRAPHPPWNRAG